MKEEFIKFSKKPFIPESYITDLGRSSFLASKKRISETPIDAFIHEKMTEIFDRWNKNESNTPLTEFRELIEPIRKMPPSEQRIFLMISILKILGQPKNLSCYLNMLIKAYNEPITPDYKDIV